MQAKRPVCRRHSAPLGPPTPTTRRAGLALALAATLGLAAPALALDLGLGLGLGLGLPRLEDLQPRWQTLGIGASAEGVLQVIGQPNGRTETQTMGLAHLTLDWKDITGRRYGARFLAGRLYAKEVSDQR